MEGKKKKVRRRDVDGKGYSLFFFLLHVSREKKVNGRKEWKRKKNREQKRREEKRRGSESFVAQLWMKMEEIKEK